MATEQMIGISQQSRQTRSQPIIKYGSKKGFNGLFKVVARRIVLDGGTKVLQKSSLLFNSTVGFHCKKTEMHAINFVK
jgi:hypothetical protein